MSFRPSFVATAILGLFLSLLSGGPSAASEANLIRSALDAAGGSDPIERTLNQRAVQRRLDAIVERVGGGKPTWRRARKIHRVLQNEVLGQYREDADGLTDILDDGSYNCVSATLLYGLVAQRLGFRAEVLEYPGHLLVRLHGRGEPIDIETTSRRGFDRGRHEDGRPPRVSGTAVELRRLDAMLGLNRRHGAGEPVYWELPLEAAVGFTWLNSAWRAMERGQGLEASRAAVAAWTRLPGLTERGDGVQRLLSDAFRHEYERGRFDEAYRIASIDVEVHPLATTSRDRLLAAGLKRIEQACEADDPPMAAALMEGTRARLQVGADLDRLERHAWPQIAAAAVRNGDWEQARAAARRYAQVEPDLVEAQRILAWIEQRAAMSSAATPAAGWGKAPNLDPFATIRF